MIGVTIYSSEIEQCIRMKRQDASDKSPGPVLVSLMRVILRDNMLRRKGDLQLTKKFVKVFIKTDELFEIRRAKSILRKASFNAKQLGDTIVYKHNQIVINEVLYTVDEIDKIPAKYLVNSQAQNKDRRDDQDLGACVAMETESTSVQTQDKKEMICPGERMKLTRKGLCFSGPTAPLSNMAYIPIVFKKQPFKSNKQGYQWLKAIDHSDEELAQEIKNTKGSYDVKKAGGIITASPEWELQAPGLIEELLVEKCRQNPEFAQRLIDTYPHDLTEASIDTHWGGGPLQLPYL